MTSIIDHPAKRRKIDFGEQVTVLVGTGRQKKEYFAHRGILIKPSTFFQSALKGEWKESKERKVELPKQRPAAFAIYLNWLYGSFIDLWDDGEEIRTWKDEDGKEFEQRGNRYAPFIQSYVLGTYILDDNFCNALVDSYFEVSKKTQRWPGAETCNIAFNELVEISKLRLLIL